MKIAVEGCCHGELDTIYDTLKFIEQRNGFKVDLLICCGDFQATRNEFDLTCMAVKQQYRLMQTFYKYYTGEKVAPVLTLFIGGNHEASNYMGELSYGGWAAPNIYYMGFASVVQFGGIRIAGLSGIYNGSHFMRGHFEKPPYNPDTLRSAYHIRNLEIFRLKQLSNQVDIALSHDWPNGVAKHGCYKRLLNKKPWFKEEIEENRLGSTPTMEVLACLKPTYWFAAHLHCKYAALVPHKLENGETKNTKFLALDKCLPRRKFLQILDIPHDSDKPLELEYDIEWLAILHITNHLLSTKNQLVYMPGLGYSERWIYTPTAEEKELVLKKFQNNLRIPKNFVMTAVPYDPHDDSTSYEGEPQVNPQTKVFCETLGIDDPWAILLGWKPTDPIRIYEPRLTKPENQPESTSISNETPEIEDPAKSDEIENGSLSTLNPVESSSKRLSKLVLPSPVNTVSIENEPIFKESEVTAENSVQENKSKNGSDDDVPLSNLSEGEQSLKRLGDIGVVEDKIGVGRKFKRRNQSMYATEDDSETQ